MMLKVFFLGFLLAFANELRPADISFIIENSEMLENLELIESEEVWEEEKIEKEPKVEGSK